MLLQRKKLVISGKWEIPGSSSGKFQISCDATSGTKVPSVFEGGIVTGFWRLQTGDEGPMHFEYFAMVNGRIRGQGDDEVGPFTICGTYGYDGKRVICRFDKQYIGAHLVIYEGSGNYIQNEPLELKGKWEIPGDWSGYFELKCDPNA